MKTCDVHGCEHPVFGTDKHTRKRYCKKHQYLRTDTVKRIRKKSVEERNNALSRKTNFNFIQWGFHDELTLFQFIWESRPHKSEISGRDLSEVDVTFLAMFAHVLNKKNYPLFRYNPDNIMLVHPQEHVLIDQGSSSARRNYRKEFPSADFGLFYTRKQELLTQYPKEGVSYEGEKIL